MKTIQPKKTNETDKEILKTLQAIEKRLKSIDCNLELITLTVVNHINGGGFQ